MKILMSITTLACITSTVLLYGIYDEVRSPADVFEDGYTRIHE